MKVGFVSASDGWLDVERTIFHFCRPKTKFWIIWHDRKPTRSHLAINLLSLRLILQAAFWTYIRHIRLVDDQILWKAIVKNSWITPQSMKSGKFFKINFKLSSSTPVYKISVETVCKDDTRVQLNSGFTSIFSYCEFLALPWSWPRKNL